MVLGRTRSRPARRRRTGCTYLQCAIGEGAAATLGEDAGKKRLAVGDTFELGDRWWKVVGIMKTRGTTYGSEIWTSVENPVVQAPRQGGQVHDARAAHGRRLGRQREGDGVTT